MKKLSPPLLLALALMLPGCAWTERHLPWHHETTTAKPAPTKTVPAKPAPPHSKTIITPDESLAATVLTVNTVGRFVILDFPEGRVPKLDTHLFLYRGGLKTAEVKVVGPRQETRIVADILSGDAHVGDTARDQ